MCLLNIKILLKFLRRVKNMTPWYYDITKKAKNAINLKT